MNEPERTQDSPDGPGPRPENAIVAGETGQSVHFTEPPAKAVLRWMTEGHDEQSIREALLTICPGADRDAAISEALAELKADGQIDAETVRGWALRAYRDLYHIAAAAGEIDDARKVMKEITTLVR